MLLLNLLLSLSLALFLTAITLVIFLLDCHTWVYANTTKLCALTNFKAPNCFTYSTPNYSINIINSPTLWRIQHYYWQWRQLWICRIQSSSGSTCHCWTYIALEYKHLNHSKQEMFYSSSSSFSVSQQSILYKHTHSYFYFYFQEGLSNWRT